MVFYDISPSFFYYNFKINETTGIFPGLLFHTPTNIAAKFLVY